MSIIKNPVLKFAASAMFAACTALSLSAQTSEPAKNEPLPESGNANRWGVIAMGRSWHADRSQYFNEYNWGGALTYRLGDESKKLNSPELALMAGGYLNSLRGLSPMTGIIMEKN